jgi:hypothetical protein
MKSESKEKAQNAVLAAVLGAIIPVAIGFGGGFWVTKQTAEQLADSARIAAKVKICVAQFANAPNYDERLKQFKSLDYSAKAMFLEKGAWAKMPGEESASDAVKESCARELEAMLQNKPG